MKNLKLYNEKVSWDEFNDICSKTPVYYAIFIITEDYKELYTEKYHTIKKGTELYITDPFEYQDMTTICPLNYITEVPYEFLEFVEYRNKNDIDEQLKIYKTSDKYNI